MITRIRFGDCYCIWAEPNKVLRRLQSYFDPSGPGAPSSYTVRPTSRSLFGAFLHPVAELRRKLLKCWGSFRDRRNMGRLLNCSLWGMTTRLRYTSTLGGFDFFFLFFELLFSFESCGFDFTPLAFPLPHAGHQQSHKRRRSRHTSIPCPNCRLPDNAYLQLPKPSLL